MKQSSLLCIITAFICWFVGSPFGLVLALNDNPPLTLSMTLRDFRAYNDILGHPDFNNEVGDEKGIALQYLTFDKKPAYDFSKTFSSTTTHGQAWFDLWYRDSIFSITLQDHIVLTWNSSNQKYVYHNDSFFPLDNRGWLNEGSDANGKMHNFGFTAEFATVFTYTGAETFTFSGDDDLWVFVNNYRIVDLGGVHAAETQTVTLSQFEYAASLKKGSRYNFNLFFAERHVESSVLHIESSFPLQDCATIDACGVCYGTATQNLCVGVDCGNGTCDCQTGCCSCAAGFSQSATCRSCTSSCGNGVVDPGEDCDVGANSDDKDAPCCDKFCHFVNSSVVCTQDPGVCKSNKCDGAGHCGSPLPHNETCIPTKSSVCLQNKCDGNGLCGIPLPAGSVCGVAANPCTQMICNANGTCGVAQLKDGTSCPGSYVVGDCVTWACQTGLCSPTPKQEGTTCPSSNLCTTGACDSSGNCLAYQNLTQCQSTNPCEESMGQCNLTTGSCIFKKLADGSACSLPNRKDCATYSCQQGTCVAHSLCNATYCGTEPQCNLTTGNCDFPPATGPRGCCGNGIKDGTEFCDDGATGCCVGCDLWRLEGTPCNDKNPCSNSTCDGFGSCILSPLPIGTPCGDSGNQCTHLVCQGNAVCTEVPRTGLACGAGDECTLSTCSSNGLCTAIAKADDTPCNTSNASNTSKCMSSVCIKGTCNRVHVPDGAACGSDACGSFECSFGACVPASNYTQCPASGACHTHGACDPSTGKCSNPLQSEGHSCPAPSHSSCQIWTCTNGVCNASCALSICGNGIVESGEDCDADNNTCCASCKFLVEGSSCESDNKTCTEDMCDSMGVCQHTTKPGCSISARLVFPSFLQIFILGYMLFFNLAA